jgi:microfibrillar-associated protein 1
MEKSFGRDEMNALLGGGSVRDELTFRPTITSQPGQTKKKGTTKEPDIASMTPAETAAMLMERKSAPFGHQGASSRYRTNRVLAHHELAVELLEEQPSNNNNQSIHDPLNNNDSDSDHSFVAKTRANASRTRLAPQILRRPQTTAANLRRKDSRLYSSSSSDSENDSSKVRRQNSSDSSSYDEDDRRRQRLLISREKAGETAELVVPVSTKVRHKNMSPNSVSNVNQRPRQHPKVGVTKRYNSESESSSEDSDSSSSNSGSSDSSSESESDTEQIRGKPIFVPKHRRNLIQSEEHKWEEEDARQRREKGRNQNRKLESRAMVAKQMTLVAENINEEDANDEAYGAPDDNDVEEQRKGERNYWELREIERLLIVIRQEKERENLRLEYERRRQMTDEQCLEEDKMSGRYNAPGEAREGERNFAQRFYHRGAYYMDSEEWSNNDIRFKAASYAKAKTGEDKIDKSQLPEVMQRRGFGLARQNTRYKGLKVEDTTDRKLRVLPIIGKQNKS